MLSSPRTHARVCRILREDPELGARVAPGERERAIAECVAASITIPRGKWRVGQMLLMSDGIGLLALSGLLTRRVGLDGRFGAELLGAGDLLRPWQGEDVESTLPHTTGWRVIEPVRVAVLDLAATERLAHYPALIGAITGRALNRSRCLGLMMAIVHHPGTDVRLHMLMWHLADRWGRVRPDGVHLPLRLSHSLLADLVAAQRPSVTMSLKRLRERGLLEAVDTGWLLHGDPPGELLELQHVAVSDARVAPRP